ncbi:hypothetical protein ACQ4LE_005106 [Meloidogyne hapla]
MILGSWIRSSFLLINKKFILKPSPNFKNKGLQNGFIIVDALVLSIFGAFSTASNGFLVFIMIKYKKEFETCHYLLGVNAVCDMIVSSSGIVTALLLAVFGTFHFTNIQCVWYHSFALIAFNMSFVLVFLIAADRFFAVFFPIRYYKLKWFMPRYVFCLCFISLLIGTSLFVYCVICIMNTNNILFRCSAADLWQGKYFTVLKPFCLSFTIAAVFCYVAIWIQIRYRKKPSTNEEKQRTEIIKSLTILLLLILFGWIFNMAMRSVIPMLIPQPVPLGFFLMNTTDIVLTFIGIANTFVLYICSNDYHRIINKFFSTIRSTTTQVVAIQNNKI